MIALSLVLFLLLLAIIVAIILVKSRRKQRKEAERKKQEELEMEQKQPLQDDLILDNHHDQNAQNQNFQNQNYLARLDEFSMVSAQLGGKKTGKAVHISRSFRNNFAELSIKKLMLCLFIRI